MRFAGAVLRQTGTVVKAEARLNATLIAISAAPGLVGLAAGADERLVNAVAGLLNLYLQLLSTVRALDVLGFAPPGYQRADMTEGRFGSAFGASLVSTVAIGLGILALIVPGIVLLALWSVWLPAIAGCRLPAAGCRLSAVGCWRSMRRAGRGGSVARMYSAWRYCSSWSQSVSPSRSGWRC